MGANEFECTARGATAEEAFDQARDQAQWDYGHRGYTGTIAEKGDFVKFDLPDGITVREFVDLLHITYGDKDQMMAKSQSFPKPVRETLLHACDVYDDKWGPAVCVEIEPGKFLFCGLASC